MSPARRAERGTTLVEMLVALVIIGAVAAALAAVLETSLIAGKRADQRLASAERGTGAVLTLRRLLATALPAPAAPGEVVFRGDASSLTFVAPGLKRSAALSLFQYRLEVLEERRGVALVLSYAPMLPPTSAGGAERGYVTLMRGLSDAHLAYAGMDGGWRPSWTEAGQMPHAVRLELAGGNIMPELVLPVHVSAPKPGRRRVTRP